MRTTRVLLLTALLMAVFLGGFRWLGTPQAQAAPVQATAAITALPTIDDFQDQAVADAMFAFGDSGTSVNKSVVTTDTVPGSAAGNSVLRVEYVSTGWGAGTGRDIPGEDWSASDGIRFWFHGDGSGVMYRLILSDNGDPNAGGDTSERFAFEWNDTVAGWRFMEIPWTLFFRDPGFQPGGAPNDGLTLTAVKAYAFALPSGNSKTIFVDDIKLFNYTDIDTFPDQASADSMFAYGDGGTSVNRSVVATDTVPGAAAGNTALQIEYVSAGWGAGTGRDIPGADWSASDGLSFWFNGDGSGVLYRIILSDNGDPNATGDTSERFAYEWNDNAAGWHLISLPWALFVRDPGFQPGGAPNDGLTLTEVKAYAFALPSGNSKTIFLDSVRLFGDGGGSTPPPPPPPAANRLPIITDFETGIPGTLGVFNGGGSSVQLGLDTQSLPQMPGSITNTTAIVTYSIGAGDYGGITDPFTQTQDWSGYDAFGFWLYGSNSGVNHRIELKSQGGNAGAANLWQYPFADNFTGWKHFVVPFSDFAKRTDYNPGAGLGDSIDLAVMWGWSLLLDPNASGTLWLDDVRLFKALYGEDFEAGVPAGLGVFNDGGSSVVLDAETQSVPDKVPGGASSGIIAYTYTIASGGFGGITFPFSASQDWSGAQSFGFWIKGSNSGVNHRIELKSQGGDPGAANLWQYPFADNFTGWKYFQAPLSDFAKRTDYNPGAGLGDSIDPAVMWGWSILLDPNSTGTIWMDDVAVLGKPAGVLKVAFAKPSYDVDEGGEATIDVALNMAATQDVTVTFATADNTAVAGSDYTATTGSLVFGPGDMVKSFTVSTIDDLDDEPAKTVNLTLSNPISVELGNASTAVLTIKDNDQVPPTVLATVDDFENGLPTGLDGNGLGIGFVTWGDPNATVAITATQVADSDPMALPGQTGDNHLFKVEINAPGWGGTTHAFENASVDTWIPQDWSAYAGITFWLFGQNTGYDLLFEINENRKPGSDKADTEIWSHTIKDDFSGWKQIVLNFRDDFVRKDIGNGAPNDDFTREQVHGWAFGALATGGSTVTYYLDNVGLYGTAGPVALNVGFSAPTYSVTEGETAVLTVSLNMTSTTPVTVTYKTAESQATPNVDFTPVSGTLVFTPGVDHLSFNVPTIDDAKDEPDERVMVNLYDAQGAALAFQRRATLTIMDNDDTVSGELGDFEGNQPFQVSGDLSLSITQLGAGDPNAVPGQGASEQVLTVEYNDAATTTNRIYNTFKDPQDWSGADGLTFWYYGNNTGKTINVELWDNQITDTNSMTTTDWVLRWADEFNEIAGTPPNPNNWKHELGDGSLNGLNGWGNSEFQYYTNDPANASTDGSGNLVLRMTEVNTATTELVCWYGPCRYTSARLISADRAEFQYGKIEARMKLPPTDKGGIWPAFWALGSKIDEGVDWPLAGEIDIMEYVSRIPNEIFGTLHGPGYAGGQSYGNKLSNITGLLDDFHTYTIEWREDHIIWYFDGVKYHEARPTDPFLTGGDTDPNNDKQWVYNQPFFLLLNVAIGGNFGGAIEDGIAFPQDTLVDYVRVYQAPISAELFEAGFVDNFTGWQKVVIPFSSFTRSADQPAGAPNDGLTLTSVNGYGFRFPSSGGGVNAQAVVTTHIDQVRLASLQKYFFPIVGK